MLAARWGQRCLFGVAQTSKSAVTASTPSRGPATLSEPQVPLAIDLAPTPPQNTYSDTVHATDPPACYRVSVRVP
jgi:hypothetical protein